MKVNKDHIKKALDTQHPQWDKELNQNYLRRKRKEDPFCFGSYLPAS